jgi:hypothetical protein
MKIVIISAFVLLNIHTIAQNSLSNTKWKGVFLIPHAVDVILNFKKDTLYLEDEKGELFGTLVFSHRSDTLMITKVSGSSPCPEQSKGSYRIEWLATGEKFLLHAISEECEGRAGVYTVNPFVRIRSK